MKYSKKFITKTNKRLPNLESLVLYILANYNNDKLKETKLHKLIYYCDFDSYELTRKPITEGTYKNNHYGPTVNELGRTLDNMEKNGKIKIVIEKNAYGSPQTRYLVTAEKLDFNFNDDSLKIIQNVNEKFRGLTSSELSAISHSDSPSLITKIGDNIDYKTVLFREDDYCISDEERKRWDGFLTADEEKKLLALAK